MTAFVAARINAMLDNLTPNLDEVSLHDGFPGTTGANEISGGGYARQTIGWASAASESVSKTAGNPQFSVQGGTTVRWIGYWDDASPANFAGYAPNQQSGDVTPLRYVIDTGANTVEAPSHGFSDDEGVVFFGGTAPTGLSEGTVYYVVNATSDDFQVQATAGASPASPIGLSSQGDQDVYFAQIREELFSGDGTFNLTGATIDFFG